MNCIIVHLNPNVEIDFFLEKYLHLALEVMTQSPQFHLNATSDTESDTLWRDFLSNQNPRISLKFNDSFTLTNTETNSDSEWLENKCSQVPTSALTMSKHRDKVLVW